MKRGLICDRSFYRTAAVLAAPVILQNVITIAVNMLDTIMLGHYGEIQLSGSSLANSFVAVFQVLCLGIGGGAAVLTAQDWGAGDIASIRKTVVLMLRLACGVAAAFFAAALLIPEKVMRLYADDPQVIGAGAAYLRIVSPTFPMTAVSITLMIVLRSVREVKLPLINAGISFFSNLFFNWVLIFGRLGLPEMQIRGAALATVIARGIETGVIIWFVLKKDRRICLRLGNLAESCREQTQRYMRYSVPVILSDFLLGLGNTAVTMIIGRLGSSFVAANAITAVVVRLSTVMNQGFASAGSIMTGNALGKGEIQRAHRQALTFVMLSVLFGLLAGVGIKLFSPAVIHAYHITEETKAIAFELMDSVALMVVFQSTQSMLTKGVLRGGGDTRFLLWADILFLWLMSIPLGYASAFVWHMRPFWIYICMKVDYIVKSVWCAFRLMGDKWMKRVAQAERGE